MSAFSLRSLISFRRRRFKALDSLLYSSFVRLTSALKCSISLEYDTEWMFSKILSNIIQVIFCSFSEAVKDYPDLVKRYLGTVVAYRDNFFAALNSAVFSDGSFVYIPKGVRCPMELSTYFRINAANTGQFERTLIVADDDSYVSYLEGCTAPMRDDNQLHAAIVEIIVEDRAEVKYSTVQNWYPGDKEGKGGIYNFVT